jgi:putative hydrolase of the HAD superfamily
VTHPLFRLICFDIGGVLVRHCRTWQEGCAAAGLPVRSGSDHPEQSQRRKQLAQLLTTGRLTDQDFYDQVAATTNGLYSPGDVARIHHAWLGPEYTGVGPVITELVQAGRIQTGVLSNTNAPHWARLDPSPGRPAQYPTASLLSNRHASHLLGLAKPMPEIYAEFERRTGVAGHEILFLEDLPENAAPAAARGWHIELIDYTRETAPQIRAVLERFDLI